MPPAKYQFLHTFLSPEFQSWATSIGLRSRSLATIAQGISHSHPALVHLDVDVIDFKHLPLAENYSKNKGLSYSNTLELLEVFLKSSKIGGLTLTEINPDHGAEDGSTIQRFAQDLSRLLALLPS